MARLEGLEPPTHCLEGSCSIHLSYRRDNPVYFVRLVYLVNKIPATCTEFGTHLSCPCERNVAIPAFNDKAKEIALSRGSSQ